MTSQKPYWTPSEQEIKDAQVTKFRQYVNKRYNINLADFWELWRWSTGTPEEMNNFWESIWDWTGVIGDKGPSPLFDASQPIYETKKFMTGATLNWAENILLSHPMARSKTAPAIHACIEADPKSGETAPLHIRTLTFEDLYQEVAQAAAGLKKLGVGPGDRIAAISSNNAEAIVMVLACSSIGAIWSSVAPEFGVTPILDRFEQLRPKVLLAVDEYRASGKTFDVRPKLHEVIPKLQAGGLTHVVLVGQLQKDRQPRGDLPQFKGVKTIPYAAILDKSATKIDFKRGPANTPLWVLYSSGTTGKPKAIIHNQLGMVFAVKAFGPLHSNAGPGDCQLQISTTGWMMWNQMVNHLSCGVSIVCYDGTPLFPRKDVLFDLIDRYNATSFSLSPRFLQVLLSSNTFPNQTHSLKSLKSIFTTGSPTKPHLYDFVREHIKPVWIHNGSGGTDVCTGMVGGVPTLPIYAGIIQVPFLGCAVAAYDDNGEKVEVGEGELVIEKPFPMMPLGFLGDTPDNARFKDAYYNNYKHKSVWYHADHIFIDENGGFTMLGRSDGVLNPQGVRFGSSELYAIVEEMKDEVDDCIAVGQRMPDGDERVILFVKPQEGVPFDSKLTDQIKFNITKKLSRRHVPALIIECQDIPYTINGKRVEVAVKKIINGVPVSKLNTTGMANPGSLNFFINHPDLVLKPKAKL